MQILRRIVLASVAATFLTPVFLHAYDNDAQLRARQALEDKMKELDTQQSITSAPPPMATQKPSATKAKRQKPAKVSKSTHPATKATEAQKPASQEIVVTPGEPPREVSPAQTAPSTTPAMQQPATEPVVSAPVAVESAPATTSSADTEEAEKLRAAMREKMQNQQTKSTEANPPGQASQPWNQPYDSHQEQHVARTTQRPKQPAPSLPPMAAPPTGVSSAKQQKLDQLLQLYRADQITPQEYHEQRAKILAEP